MLVSTEVVYIHSLRVGNTTITLRDVVSRSEDYVVNYIADRLIQFDTDNNTGELLFYKTVKQNDFRSGMSYWFSYPANVKTSLDLNSTGAEVRQEFIRIYKEFKEKL